MRADVAATALSFLALAASASEPTVGTPEGGYSTSTLREPIFDSARVAVDTVTLNNWLIGNHEGLDERRRQRVREQLYYLIDSRIKEQFARSGRIMPTEHDLILELLFSWAEILGVHGGNLVFNALKAPERPARPPTLPRPDGISLELAGDLFRVKSDMGWEVAFPYYFMIGRFQDFTGRDGGRMQIMIVSTGAAPDAGPDGHSQATLMLICSPNMPLATFRSFWEPLFGLRPEDETVELGVRGLTSQRTMQPGTVLHLEVVFWPEQGGSHAVAYLGNDGTYQWNRQHFLGFLQALRTRAPRSSRL